MHRTLVTGLRTRLARLRDTAERGAVSIEHAIYAAGFLAAAAALFAIIKIAIEVRQALIN